MFKIKIRVEKLEADLKLLKDTVDGRERKISCVEGRHEWELDYKYGEIVNWCKDFNKPYIRCKHCYLEKTEKISEKGQTG